MNPEEDKFRAFNVWLNLFGFCPPGHLILTDFEGTGRGIVTTREITAGELLISIPEKLLITTKTVLVSRMGVQVKSFLPVVSPVQAICAFLMMEQCLGRSSKWEPYLAVLPCTYSTSAFCPRHLFQYFPRIIQERIKDYNLKLTQEYIKLRPFLVHLQSTLQLPEDILNFTVFRWAWTSVNTRCVYLHRRESLSLWPAKDHCALAPFLDFLNHSGEAKVLAGFNAETQTYDIRVLQNVQAGQQVFICYGSHDNSTLLLEYGFVLPQNKHSTVSFQTDDVLLAIGEVFGQSAQIASQTKLLKMNTSSVLRDLCATWEGPSWCLTRVVELLLESEEPDCCNRVLHAMFSNRINSCLKQKTKHKTPKKCSSFFTMAKVLIDEEFSILKECLEQT